MSQEKTDQAVHQCIHLNCTATSTEVKLITPSFEAIDNLEAALNVISTPDRPFLLCQQHYQEVYRKFKSPWCASCGVKPKSGTYFTRHSPDASTVTRALHQDGFDGIIRSTDYICSTCYKVHLAIIQSMESQSSTPDNMLKDLICIWEHKISNENTDKLTKVILQVVLFVATELLHNRAVLLPHVSSMFVEAYKSSSTVASQGPLCLEVGEGTIEFSSRWLLNQLIVYLHEHMSCKCVHRKFGTILFRKGGDLLTSLSWALARMQGQCSAMQQPGYWCSPDMDTHKARVLGEAGAIVNDLLHSEINGLNKDKLNCDPSKFNFDQLISQTNQQLWSFLESATQTVRERTTSGGDSESARHKKRVRRFYILCLLMYCINSKKSTPVHTLLSDTIEMCGGSRVLIRILNQLGAVASTDTHDRFVTAVAENQRAKSVWDTLPDNVFTVVSADNFDMLQSHAAVYCGDQSRSYHGTTVQIVQPDPKLILTDQGGLSTGQENLRLSLQEGQSISPTLTSLFREGSSAVSVPTLALQEGQSISPTLTSLLREGSSAVSVPTLALQEGQSISPTLTSLLREGSSAVSVQALALHEGQSISRMPTSLLHEGSSAVSVPTLALQEGQSISPTLTSLLREGSSAVSVPTLALQEGQSISPTLTSLLREGSSAVSVQALALQEGQSISRMPTSLLQEGSSAVSVQALALHERQSISRMPTSLLQEGSSAVSVQALALHEGQSISRMPTSLLQEGSSAVSVQALALHEGQSISRMPTSPLREGQTLSPMIISPIREGQSIVSQACSTQPLSLHTTLDMDTIAVGESTPTAAVIAAKRKGKYSPASSPHKLGKIGPKRPRTVAVQNLMQKQSSDTHSSLVTRTTFASGTVTMEGFSENSDEMTMRQSLESKTFAYMLSKHSLHTCIKALGEGTFKEFKEFFANSVDSIDQDPSNIYYMELLDENPDSSDTMRHLAEILLENASSVHQDKYVVLVGDGKTYEHLMKIKRLYGAELKKLLIFPGDWHTLKNYQPVLMKIYYSVGLKELAKTSGFRAETLTSLEKCSNFKRTHQFILQAWQAIYRQMINAYLNSNKDLLPQLTEPLYSVLASDVAPTEMLVSVEELLSRLGQYEKFRAFVQRLSEVDDIWAFWNQFVFQDCLAYVGLFLSIRCQNWKLRVASLKLMAPLFIAYDRTTYQRLIPNHLADIQSFPKCILKCLEEGAFAVSIRGYKGHSVALDEAHEMCINRDMKAAIVRPSKAYLLKTSLFLRYRIAAHKNLLQQLFPTASNTQSQKDNCSFSTTPEVKEREDNITAMFKDMDCNSVLPHNISSNRGLGNIFSSKPATPEQAYDLLNFRKIGSNDLKLYIRHRILRQPSTDAPVRQHRLLTMAATKTGKRKLSHKEREHKQVTKCLRQRLAWCNRTGQTYNPAYEQYSVHPRAIADTNGLPNKGVKATWTDKLKKRYSAPNLPVVMDCLPLGWTPHAVIIDGMFLINCSPLRSTSTITEYATFLLNRFTSPHYLAGAKEVHLVFDTSNHVASFNPKCYERARRDQSHTTDNHQHISFLPNTTIPHNWRTYIECRKCKRAIIEAIGMSYIQSARFRLKPDQKLIVAGCFSDSGAPWVVSGDGTLPTIELQYNTNAEEADMRIWRHVQLTSACKILVYSPDTDVYNIGLPILQSTTECIVQLNLPHSQDLKYLHLNNLIEALEGDPDLASLPRDKLRIVMQMLFITSGCDYISFFSGFGKAAFLNIFFQHASFITGNQSNGLLSENSKEGMKQGFLAFLRLVGTLYFKKYLSAFVSLRDVETPNQYLNSIHTVTT